MTAVEVTQRKPMHTLVQQNGRSFVFFKPLLQKPERQGILLIDVLHLCLYFIRIPEKVRYQQD